MERLKSLERLFNGDVSAIEKLNSITVTKVVKNVSGVIAVELLNRPMQVSRINSVDWLDCIGLIYKRGGSIYFKSFVPELQKWDGKHEAGIVELPIFFNLDLDVV